jgi:hypothetical protein
VVVALRTGVISLITTTMNVYDLSRKWFDWSFENPEKINPNHTALYFFIIEHCNRLGWKSKFGLPTTMSKEAIGIRSYNTFIKTLNDLVNFGFIELIEKSKNQYSSNIIALSNFDKAPNKALDNAIINHNKKQRKSIVSIDKQINNNTNTPINNDIDFYFAQFWNEYDKKVDRSKCYKAFLKINPELFNLIIDKATEYKNATPEIKFRKNPLTWLNGQCWNDETLTDKPKKIMAFHPIIFD